MTIVVYRNGIIAADKNTVMGNTIYGQTRKIWKRGTDGALVGAGGCSSLAAGFCRWFMGGEQGDRPSLRGEDNNSAGAIVIMPDGRIIEHDFCGWRYVDSEFVALGSGMDIAYGALEMGASAVEAVRIVCKRDIHCGGGINTLWLGATNEGEADGREVAA